MSDTRFSEYLDAQIDVAKLKDAGPLLLDTGVLLRALDEVRPDPRTPLCRELLEKAILNGVLVLVASPTIAEVLRNRRQTPPQGEDPLTRGIVTVALDREAATFCGEHFRMTRINDAEIALRTGQKGFYKYDALIISCAARWQAKTVVTLDQKMRDRLGWDDDL